MLQDVLLLQKCLVGKSGQKSPANPTVDVSFRGQNGVDAVCRWLEESWIFSEAFSWLTVTVYRFQGVYADVRELAGRCSNNRTILFVQLSELRHKSPRVHPFEIRNPGSCKEFGTRILSQGMKVNVIDDVHYEIDCSLVASVLVAMCWKAERVDNVE